MNPRERIVLLLPEGPPRAALEAAAAELGYRRFATARRGGFQLSGRPETISVREVGSPQELAALLAAHDPRAPMGVRWTSDRVIPHEALVARSPRASELWVLAGGPEQVPAALGALERGARTVVVPIGSREALDHLDRLLGPDLPERLRWSLATVRSIEPVGLGDRVLVDTTSILTARSALLVGSVATFLFAAAAEVEGSTFSGPRSFRFNAGAAHSYVLTPDGSTRYLAELRAGEELLTAPVRGRPDRVRVGRIKIERRPLVHLEVDHHGRTPTLFAQEAETVRLFSSKGRAAVTSLRTGDRIWGVSLPPARHLGAVVDESIEER
jgi:3-dehydroquinate synthase II